MRTVNFRDAVLFPVCHECGIDPTKDLLKDQALALFQFIHNWTQDGWEAEDWPELNLTEERAFRRIWYDDEQYIRKNAANFNLPDQLYNLTSETYYQVIPTAPADPPIGTPVTDATYFEPLTSFDRYIELDQPGKQAIGLVRGIFNVDPSVQSGRKLSYELGDNGIEIYSPAGNTVWLRYQVRPSIFAPYQEYDPDATYKRGDAVYDSEGGSNSGEVYRALANLAAGNAPPNTGLWQLQPMPGMLAKFVMYAAAADYVEDAQTKADKRSLAERALQKEIDKLYEQGRRLPRYGRNIRRGPRRITRCVVPEPVVI